jgi:hypothetical protein
MAHTLPELVHARQWSGALHHTTTTALVDEFYWCDPLNKEGCARQLRKLAAGVWMLRWTVLCSELFLVMTVSALTLAVFRQDVTRASAYFNVVYTVTYASFLVAYAAMRTAPAPSFVSGVAFYFLGYAASFFMCVAQLTGNTAAPALYALSSLLFLVGSAFLVFSTWSPDLWRMSPTRLGESSLFWGSAAFLCGSGIFTADATCGIAGIFKDYAQPALLSGLGFFATGRLFFLRGAVTPKCGVFFRATAAATITDTADILHTVPYGTIGTPFQPSCVNPLFLTDTDRARSLVNERKPTPEELLAVERFHLMLEKHAAVSAAEVDEQKPEMA